jgi:PAS domain S-box-containing protein
MTADMAALPPGPQELQALFLQLASHIDTVLFIRDVDPPRYVYVSEASARIWGVAAADLMQDPGLLFRNVVPEDLEKVLGAARVSQEAYDLEYRLHRDGVTRWIRTRGFPVTAGDGSLRVVGVAEDVSERKEIERVREELTHMLVHDLRTPLTAARGAIELVESTSSGLSETARELLLVARRGTLRVVNLVSEILDVSRLEQKAMPVEPKRLQLARCAREVVELKAPLAREKGIALTVEASPELPEAWADPGLLGRVLQNLVGNAVKFTPAGGRVVVRVGEAPRELVVTVADSGPGIPEEMRGRLFQKFATGRQPGRGTGLGLAFCKLAVEAGGGRIWVEHPPGGGTVVGFSVPRPVVEA